LRHFSLIPIIQKFYNLNVVRSAGVPFPKLAFGRGWRHWFPKAAKARPIPRPGYRAARDAGSGRLDVQLMADGSQKWKSRFKRYVAGLRMLPRLRGQIGNVADGKEMVRYGFLERSFRR
jgi:hypothetical protein